MENTADHYVRKVGKEGGSPQPIRCRGETSLNRDWGNLVAEDPVDEGRREPCNVVRRAQTWNMSQFIQLLKYFNSSEGTN